MNRQNIHTALFTTSSKQETDDNTLITRLQTLSKISVTANYKLLKHSITKFKFLSLPYSSVTNCNCTLHTILCNEVCYRKINAFHWFLYLEIPFNTYYSNTYLTSCTVYQTEIGRGPDTVHVHPPPLKKTIFFWSPWIY